MRKNYKMNIPDLTQIKLVASAIIVDKNSRILMLKRSINHKSFRGLWQLPEGKLEVREVAREAMEREVKEETGLVVVKSEPLTVTQILTKTNGISYLIVRIVFLVGCDGILQLSDEHKVYKWVSNKELKKLKTIVGTKQIVADFWREKRNVHSFAHWTERDGKINYREGAG
jgi:8-oxo-dGTP diphosphatase